MYLWQSGTFTINSKSITTNNQYLLGNLPNGMIYMPTRQIIGIGNGFLYAGGTYTNTGYELSVLNNQLHIRFTEISSTGNLTVDNVTIIGLNTPLMMPISMMNS